MRHVLIATAAVAAAALGGVAGCSHGTGAADAGISTHLGRLRIDGDGVGIVAGNGSEARLTSDGHLLIGGRDVKVPDAARARLATYYGAAVALTEHAKATGKAGAEVGATAATEVVKGLTSGGTANLGDKIEAKANAVRESALKLCDDLAVLRVSQEAIVPQVPEFAPYAIIEEDEPARCRKGSTSS